MSCTCEPLLICGECRHAYLKSGLRGRLNRAYTLSLKFPVTRNHYLAVYLEARGVIDTKRGGRIVAPPPARVPTCSAACSGA